MSQDRAIKELDKLTTNIDKVTASIKDAILNDGRSYEDIAKAATLSGKTLRRICDDKCINLYLSTLLDISRALGIEPEEFFK